MSRAGLKAGIELNAVRCAHRCVLARWRYEGGFARETIYPARQKLAYRMHTCLLELTVDLRRRFLCAVLPSSSGGLGIAARIYVTRDFLLTNLNPISNTNSPCWVLQVLEGVIVEVSMWI